MSPAILLNVSPSMALLEARSGRRTSPSGFVKTSFLTSIWVCSQTLHAWNYLHSMMLHVDVSVVGSQWIAGGSPSLAHLIKGAALDVPHPSDPERTLWDARQDGGPFHGGMDTDVMDEFMDQRKSFVESDLDIPPLGSGSDYTPFLQYLGVSSPGIYAVNHAPKTDSRLPVWTRASPLLSTMPRTTTTLYTIPRGGKRFTQTLDSFAMYAVSSCFSLEVFSDS